MISTALSNNHTVQSTETGNHLFPVFLKLEELEVLLVGGGAVAVEKLKALLANAPGTTIRLVASEVSAPVKTLAAGQARVTWQERPFDCRDLDGADLVIIAINDPLTARDIRQRAKAAGKLVNVADQPELCDFYLGSVVNKGQVKIAISTNGKSPTLAKRLREMLDGAIPPEISESSENLHRIRQRLAGDFPEKVRKLNHLTRVLAAEEREGEKWRRMATYVLVAFGLMLLGHVIFSYLPLQAWAGEAVLLFREIDGMFWLMVLAGFLAQLVDGATTMGYGVTSAIVLMSANVHPAAISGSIHAAEIFASGASGYSHYRFGNVNRKMFRALLIPGVLGAVFGALVLVKFGETHLAFVRTLMAGYTLFLGIKILINAFRQNTVRKKFKHYGWLAGAGGFLDSFGGGGWGPIVTATLIMKGRTPRFVVGSVSLTEFFVTVASAFTFFLLIGMQHWPVIIGLVLGGLVAAPFAARLQGKLPKKASFIFLGSMVVIWSLVLLFH